MSTFSASSFLVPSLVSFLAFAVWVFVLRRAINCKVPLWCTLLGLVWMVAILALAVYDLNTQVTTDNVGKVILVAALKTIVRLGILGCGVIVYVLLGKAYILRIVDCPVEPTPKRLRRALAKSQSEELFFARLRDLDDSAIVMT